MLLTLILFGHEWLISCPDCFTSGKSPCYPLKLEDECYPTDDLRHFGGQKNILPLSETEPLIRCLPHSLVTTHATLTQHGTKETNRS